jgi:NAD(P)H-flavin reductase
VPAPADPSRPGAATVADVAVPQAPDPMATRPYRVVERRQDTADTATLVLRALDGEPMSFAPGQFTMLQAFGVGEVPLSISGDPAEPDRLVHTVRDVGGVTRAVVASQVGDVLGARGPYGTGWQPLDAGDGDLVVVAGGIGLAPLRPAILEAMHRRGPGRVVLMYGARTPDDLLYPDDLRTWAEAGVQVMTTVDGAAPTWPGRVGLVTALIAAARLAPERALALVCGPEVMMRHVTVALGDAGLPADRIRLSMERSMACGVGLCGHCQLREVFVCLDGPVFTAARIGPLLRTREL